MRHKDRPLELRKYADVMRTRREVALVMERHADDIDWLLGQVRDGCPVALVLECLFVMHLRAAAELDRRERAAG